MRGLLLLAALAACGPLPEPGTAGADGMGTADPGSISARGATAAEEQVPPGHGSLRQDEFTIQLRSGPLLIKVAPLEESVIRLAAPDTYRRLHALAQSHGPTAAAETGEAAPALFLVSFFSYEPDTRYEPESLQIEHRGALIAPLVILPLTPDFGRERLMQQEVRSAVYAFPSTVELWLPVGIRYGQDGSDAWERLLPRLESERARVRARAGG